MTTNYSNLNHFYFNPVREQTIIDNSAYCKLCNQRVKSIAHNIIIQCRCNNITLSGGKKFIYHIWKQRDRYVDCNIIYLRDE